MNCRRRSFLVATASTTAGLGLGLLGGARASWAQESRYEIVDLDWHDPARDRAVPLRLYLPRAATPDSPVPLVVFSHGIGGSRFGYSYLGRHWASRGLASLHVQHVGSDRSLWGGGSLFSLVGRLQEAAQETEAVARVHDLRFAIDRLLAGELGPLVDGRRIVAAGHSYGANTTLLAAGARVERAGGVIDLHDPRLRAAIVISAPPFYGEGEPQRILAPVRVPSLHITATEDVIRIPGYYSGAEDRVAIFEAVGSANKTLAVFAGGSHSMFTDRTGTGGTELNAQVKLATRDLTSAFMRSVLDGNDHDLRDWPLRHAVIVNRFERGAG
ncbi:alpha/beta hydrolase family protein [Rivibacter subsaxonicus]|uniref:Putative dienelactone hydrolase n=1 Tax=Rivibacter subsaxonicus TaxID=457575 RepID=A0A4Q7W1L0_9BURK|nr:acetylhydrolase [Rivibacter subsaxonicus]RZU03030.1 putative dienelactone hydrolase [Rivibacter subsaxonicus]